MLDNASQSAGSVICNVRRRVLKSALEDLDNSGDMECGRLTTEANEFTDAVGGVSSQIAIFRFDGFDTRVEGHSKIGARIANVANDFGEATDTCRLIRWGHVGSAIFAQFAKD